MKRISSFSRFAVLILLVATKTAHAQASRTWVSGVGDDANVCSRTAPCRTFAGALAVTNAGGEISVLDTGSFGTVTINKSITISNDGVGIAGVLASGVTGITIDAAATDRVVLRGLEIEGLGTGLSGIKVLSASVVHVENCTIHGFTQWGIDFVPSAATVSTSQLHVSNTILRDNLGVSSGGIRVKAGTNVTAVGSIENTQLRNNAFGLRVEDNSKVTAKMTTAAASTFSGFIAVSATIPATLNLDSCVTTGNFIGIKADGFNAAVRITNCTIAGNTNGLTTTGGSHIFSFGNNPNADSGVPTDRIVLQ
jgi:hypothetical protein